MKGILGDLGEMKILLKPDAKPMQQRPYRLNTWYNEWVKSDIDWMLDAGSCVMASRRMCELGSRMDLNFEADGDSEIRQHLQCCRSPARSGETWRTSGSGRSPLRKQSAPCSSSAGLQVTRTAALPAGAAHCQPSAVKRSTCGTAAVWGGR